MLIALTIAVVQAPGRYRIVGPDLLTAQRTEHTPSIRVHRFASAAASIEAGQFRLRGLGAPRISLAGFSLPPLPDTEFLHIRAQIRVQALTLYNQHWGAGGIAIHSHDGRGQRIWYWPSSLARFRGRGDWRTLEYVWPVAAQAQSIRLFAYILSDPQAVLTARNLTVRRAQERGLYKAASYALWAAWAILLLAWLITLVRVSHRQPGWYRWPCYVSLLSAVAIIGAGITPHPHLGNSLGWGQARLMAAAYQLDTWLVDLTSAEDTAAAQAEASGAQELATADVAKAAPSDGQSTHSADQNPRHPVAKTSSATAAAARWRELPEQPAPTPPKADRLGHALVFTFLSIIALLGWHKTPTSAVLGCVVLTSISVQTLQNLIITRDAELLDLTFDLAGIALGALIVMTIRHLRSATIYSQ
ncbi:MAG: hypothetical protein GKR94_15190 [Gammaproteobacteria bacterium]|nr:hypothetical protein [Gammaproteobacteria bacterium]